MREVFVSLSYYSIALLAFVISCWYKIILIFLIFTYFDSEVWSNAPKFKYGQRCKNHNLHVSNAKIPTMFKYISLINSNLQMFIINQNIPLSIYRTTIGFS